MSITITARSPFDPAFGRLHPASLEMREGSLPPRVRISGVAYLASGVPTVGGDFAVTVGDNEGDRYFEFDATTGVITSQTNGAFTTGKTPLYVITTTGRQITQVIDCRGLPQTP